MLLDANRLKEQSTQSALGKEQGLFDPNLGRQELREYTQIQNQMTAEARKAAVTNANRSSIRSSHNLSESGPACSTSLNSDLSRALNGWMTKQESAGKAFGNALGEMEAAADQFRSHVPA